MSEIAVFENKQFGEIRTINDNEQIWFVAKDIAEALEYSDASNPARLMQSVPDMWKGVKRIHIKNSSPWPFGQNCPACQAFERAKNRFLPSAQSRFSSAPPQ